MIIRPSEIKDIKNKFNDVIRYSQHIDSPKTDDMFLKWFHQKKSFIKAFGGLIYELPEPITVELSDKVKEEKVADFKEWLLTRYNAEDLVNFITSNEASFFDNTVTIGLEDKGIPVGMKLLKAFKFFVDDKDILNNIQNRASMIIQETKVTGTLCLSVHPLDFLSSSETTYKWRSCHSLDGEYRAGNLSYMLDSSTCMCYLRPEGEYKLPNFPESVPWNSKKWRMLLHFSDDRRMVFAGRPYPFALNSVLDTIHTIITELKLMDIPQDHWWWSFKLSPWMNTYITHWNSGIEGAEEIPLNHKYILHNGNSLKSLNRIVKNGSCSCHYNDVLYSSCYNPYYAYVTYEGDRLENISGNSRFEIGGSTFCLKCNKEPVNQGSDSMLCCECSEQLEYEENNRMTCVCCGGSRYIEDGYWVEDEFVCDDCMETETCECEDCGNTFFNESLTYDSNSNRYICRYCLNERNG